MPEPTQEQWVSIQAMLAEGKMIQAIKIYREATGLGLKEAKDAMEAYYEKLRAEAPDRFAERAKTGCAGVILLFGLIGAAVAAMMRISLV